MHLHGTFIAFSLACIASGSPDPYLIARQDKAKVPVQGLGPAVVQNVKGGRWYSGKASDSTTLSASDSKLDWGVMNPGNIMDSFRANCKGGLCQTSWELKTAWPYEAGKGGSLSRVEKGKLVITATDAILHADHLQKVASALQIFLDKVKKAEMKPLTDAGPKGCFGKMCRRDDDDEYVNNGRVESNVGPTAVKIEIREKPKDGKKVSEMPVVASVRITFAVKRPSAGGGLCGTFAGIGGAVAGAVNPVLGTMFSVGALACIGVD